MCVIKDLKIGQSVYGLIYGKGLVSAVYEDSFYRFEVTYTDGSTIPYTEDGVPGWGLKLDLQTVFNIEDIDIMDYDITPSDEVISVKKVIKYLKDDTLELRVPSGIWLSSSDVPQTLIEMYVMSNKLHLFRRKQK